MSQFVDVSGVGRVEFPDDMSQEDIKSALDDNFGGEKVSALKAGFQHAAVGVAPGAAFVAAAGPSAAYGAELGTAFGPLGTAIGGGAGALLGGGAAAMAAAYAQRKALEVAAPEYAGQLQRELAAGEEQHPLASFAGDIASMAPSSKLAPFKLAQLPFRAGVGGVIGAANPIVFEQRAPTAKDIAAGAAAGALFGEGRFKVGKGAVEAPPVPPAVEPAAPIERVTPEQAVATAERMSAPFEEKLASEPSVVAPEKIDVKPVKSRAQLLAEEVEAAREASDAAFKAKQAGVKTKPTTTLPNLLETLGRDEVAMLVDTWEQGAELSPDGKSITVYADPRNQTGKIRGKTKDFLSWYEEQKSSHATTTEAEQVVPPTPATEIKATEVPPPVQPDLETAAPKVAEAKSPEPTDRLQVLTDKVESGTTLTKKEIQEYKTLRDAATGQTPEQETPSVFSGPGGQPIGEPPYSAIQQLTDQLKTAPPVGDREKLAWRERISDALTQGKQGFERALGKSAAISATIKDTARGVRTVQDLDRKIGTVDWLIQQSAGQSKEAGKAIESQMRNKPTRDAVAIWIDSNGDKAAIQDTLSSLPKSIKPRVRRALERALNLPIEAKQFAEQLKQFNGIQEKRAIESGVFKEGLSDYYTHIWEKENNMPDEMRVALSNGKIDDYFQFARQRKISTFLEGIRQGKNPILDPAKVIPLYNFSLDRAIASREFIKSLSEIDAPDGRPAVLPNGTAVPLEKGGEPSGLVIDPKGKTELGKEYMTINHPAMRQWKWIGKDENGNPILYRGDLAVNPLLHERLSRMLDRTRQTPTKTGAFLLRAGSEVKAAKLAAFPSLFHQVHVGSHALWHWTNPFKTEAINWEDPNTRFAVEKGHLKLAADPTDITNLSEDIFGQGLVHKIPGIGPISKAYSEYLFGEYIPQIKLKTFNNAYARNLKFYAKDIASGKVTPEQVASRIGDSMNNAFGELNHLFLGKYGRAPEFKRILRGIFLAPDFGEARLRFTEKAFTKFGHEERLAFATMFVTMYVAARIGNMLSHGDPEWDPKNMFSVKVGKHWYSMRSVAGDLLHAMTNAGQFMYVRLNPLYSRTISDMLFQRDASGRKLSWEEMLVKRPLEQLIPINLSNLTRQDQTLWESFVTSMGLQSRHNVPQFEMSQAVRHYMKQSDDPKLKAMADRLDMELFAPSDYKGLRTALKNGDLDTARKEYNSLITEKQKKQKDIDKTISPLNAKMQEKAYGPLSEEEWLKFKNKMTPSQLQLLKDANAERRQIYDNYRRMKAMK